MIVLGLFPWLNRVVVGLGLPFVPAGMLLLFTLAIITGAITLPFDLYSTFVVERRFGFSTITPGLWLVDLIKSLLIAGILLGVLMAVFLALMQRFPYTWWIFVWAFYAFFQLLMLWIYPVLIAPVFNTFKPVEDKELKDSITELAHRVGLSVTGVFSMDAGLRSRHSNAYFTGIGKAKRIVLYDTLLGTNTQGEILAVLGHELGHFKLGHIRKQIIFSLAIALGCLYGIYWLLQWAQLYSAFGLSGAPAYAGLGLLMLVASPFAFFLSPAAGWLSRRFERQADDFAFALCGESDSLVRALKRLATDNLANLHPHPVYAWFYYSHPPLNQRIEHLKDMGFKS